MARKTPRILAQIHEPSNAPDKPQNPENDVVEGQVLASSTTTLARINSSSSTQPDIVARLMQAKHNPHTVATYEVGLRAFFDGEITSEKVARFLALEVPEITLALLDFKTKLRLEGKSDATINNRLAAVRALLQFAFRLGLSKTDGRRLVDSEKVQAFRDTRGIGLDDLKMLLKAPSRKYEKLGPRSVPLLRDNAILLLLCENAFRRGEVHKLDVGDFSHREKRVWIIGKGRKQKEPATISKGTADAIGGYLLAAGHANTTGPLFLNLDHRPEFRGKRLTPKSLHKIVKGYGNAIGVPNLAPHKLRHSAVTLFLDSGGDIRTAQKLARHRSVETTMIYDDNRSDLAGGAVNLLSGLLTQKRR